MLTDLALRSSKNKEESHTGSISSYKPLSTQKSFGAGSFTSSMVDKALAKGKSDNNSKIQRLANTRKDRDKLFQALKTLDPLDKKRVTVTLFKTCAKDHNIELESRSLQYIMKNRCDKEGCLDYQKLIKDLVIRQITDVTGKEIYKWHIK